MKFEHLGGRQYNASHLRQAENITRETFIYRRLHLGAGGSIAFVTTWIGAELSYIQDGLNVIGLQANAYYVFINSLKYSFYPILTLGFVLMLIFSQRDFGPMLHAERKARMATSNASETGDNQKKTLISPMP